MANIFWQAKAICADYPNAPEIFYQADSIRDTDNSLTVFAKNMCSNCPVKEECLAYALEYPDVRGVFGGTTSEDRKAIRKTAKRKRN